MSDILAQVGITKKELEYSRKKKIEHTPKQSISNTEGHSKPQTRRTLG